MSDRALERQAFLEGFVATTLNDLRKPPHIDERAELEAAIWHALRSDYLNLPSLPKGTRNMECARDERRARVIAAVLIRQGWRASLPETPESEPRAGPTGGNQT